MSSVEFGITFGKKTFNVTLEKERTLGDLRKEIYLVTGVEPSQQKLMGLVPAGKNLREISDDTPLGNGLVKGQTWKRPRQKIIMFGASEKELNKQRDEEQEAIKKTQAIRDQFELMETEERRLDEEEDEKFAVATKRKMDRQYQSEVKQNISRIKSFEESLTAGFLGIPFAGFGGEAFAATSSTYDSPASQIIPPFNLPFRMKMLTTLGFRVARVTWTQKFRRRFMHILALCRRTTAGFSIFPQKVNNIRLGHFIDAIILF